MTAPDKIWAVFEPHHSKKGPPHVMATCEETKGFEYTRTDTIPDPLDDPRVVALIEALKHEVKRSRRHLAKSTIDALTTITKEPPHER